jgi:hypothetical protein
MFDYIVCFYFGNRRTSLTNFLLKHNRYGFVKRHIDFLEKLTITGMLNNVIFVYFYLIQYIHHNQIY